MAIQITAIRWSTDDNSRAEVVSWIENQNGKAYVEDSRGHRVTLGVVTPSYGPKYLRTYADGAHGPTTCWPCPEGS